MSKVLAEDDETSAHGDAMSVPALPIEYFDDSEACRELWSEVLILAVREWRWLHGQGTCSGLCLVPIDTPEKLKRDLERFFFEPNEMFEIAVDACEWVHLVNGQWHVFKLNKQAFREAMRRIQKCDTR